ncbi:hypothetical protein JQ554_05220 [Bradyrhizobium diazoefficiens]|nr:hypothetical protein [Bradyrhizobium diazoefficiens]UCF52687.1 MAG: hypothetical protein JSV48_26420 [Bradyrhizobium sp.]MBR0963497.1 hypothetical protein [Bradyrhizobium diazoefficiens]MBR0976310.1 hypothetical protein [Bradyrhizobium diazoefficiens]MBR1007158.1 hypothetical protein [Bradyrhizobium diazoefficiens]MBR1013270.1 hypothetical protein [Bradyrhizobium diazoefficiens]
MTDDTHQNLDRLLQSGHVRLGRTQRDRLDWLVGQYGAATFDDISGGRQGGVIMLREPPSGAAAELFYRALTPGCAVVIPTSENPGFDFLKSKLTEFGTVGPCGADGPHEMWWGGIGWSKFITAADAATTRPRIVSCYPRRGDATAAFALRHSLERFELACHIESIDTEFSDRVLCFEKAEFMVRMWNKYREPLLFVEAGAVLREAPLLPSFLGCDVALHKWNRWEMSARTLYLGRTERAEMLLRTWQHLAASYPAIWEGYLLDQAWSLTSSQVPLDTVWLPRSYHALQGDLGATRATVLHNEQTTTLELGPDPAFANIARTARRAGRTGARDAFMVMTSNAQTANGVAVILRDIAASDAGAVAATVEAVTGAYAADCGGYGRLELSLCAWQDDVGAARDAASMARYRILEIAPGQRIANDFFVHQAADDAVMTARHLFP